MSDQTIAIVSFTGALKREIVRIQKRLAQCGEISAFEIKIDAAGRVSGGDVKIQFQLKDGNYGGISVDGNNLDEICSEFLRRHGWTKQNAPLMLTANEQQRSDSDRTYTNDADDADSE